MYIYNLNYTQLSVKWVTRFIIFLLWGKCHLFSYKTKQTLEQHMTFICIRLRLFYHSVLTSSSLNHSWRESPWWHACIFHIPLIDNSARKSSDGNKMREKQTSSTKRGLNLNAYLSKLLRTSFPNHLHHHITVGRLQFHFHVLQIIKTFPKGQVLR